VDARAIVCAQALLLEVRVQFSVIGLNVLYAVIDPRLRLHGT